MTDTAAGLLADILATPDDDAPRLVYADLLTTNGDPRGELVTIQCALARAQAQSLDGLVALEVNDLERHVRLVRRQNVLLAEHRERWTAEALGGRPSEFHSVVFRRGFPEDVTLHGTEVVRAVRELRARSPLRSLAILQTVDASARELARLDLSSLRSLSLLEHGKLQNETRALLLDAASSITTLRVEYPAALDVATLARAPGLESVDIVSARLGGAAIDVLARMPFASTLRSLGLGGSGLGEKALDTLDGRFPALDAIDLRSVGLSDVILDTHLRRVNAQFPRTLKLAHNGLGTDGARALASTASLASVVELDLTWNRIGDDGLRAIAESPHLEALRSLSAAGTEMSDHGARALAEARTARLRVLDVTDSWLTAAGIGALVGASTHVLERLAYSYRRPKNHLFGDETAEAIAREPRAASIRRLALTGVKVGDAGAAALGRSPHLAHLRSLDLHDNQISDGGVSALGSAERPSGLVDLRLTGNRWTARSVPLLANEQSFPYLVRLNAWLTGWRAGVREYDALRAVLGERLFH